MSSKIIGLSVAIAVAGCTQSAPPLPPDYGSVSGATLRDSDFSTSDLTLSCSDIAIERAREEDRVQQAEAVIKGDRTGNQIAGYFGALFILPLIAVDTNEEQVALVNSSKRRVDTLRTLSRYRRCG